MNDEYKQALRNELSALRSSPDRPAKGRRINEVLAQLGEAPEENAAEAAPRERAVKAKA
jgi:hypothetical protein